MDVMMSSNDADRERGAAAVEAATMVSLLLVLMLGSFVWGWRSAIG